MARKSNSTIAQEELYPPPGETPEREAFENARLLDLEEEQESPFLRGQKRVSVRRGPLPKKAVSRIKWVVIAVFVLGVVGTIAAQLYSYGKHSWRFRIDSSDQIEISGAQHVTHAQILDVMGGDIGRNIFFIPLGEREKQIEQIPWVESASVMRFVPNRLRINIQERTPVAFARIGSRISLIDAGGTVMDLTPGGKRKYSFPVIAGMNAGEPLSTRAARMKSYNELVRQIDSGGAHYSQELSEVDLEDPEDIKVVVGDPNGDVLVHMGSGNYLSRYKIYVTHVQQWRQQFDKLESVDLRYDGQIIVNPDLQGMPRQAATLTPAAAKAAMAAGVKQAAIVNYEKYVTHSMPAPAAKKPAKAAAKTTLKPPVKVAGKTGTHKTVAKTFPRKHAPVAKKITPASKKTPIVATPQVTKQLPSTKAENKSEAASTPGTSSVVNSKKPSAAIPKETAQDHP